MSSATTVPSAISLRVQSRSSAHDRAAADDLADAQAASVFDPARLAEVVDAARFVQAPVDISATEATLGSSECGSPAGVARCKAAA